MHPTMEILGGAFALVLGACAPSTYDGAPRSPAVLALPGAGVPGPGTPRVHLELVPADSTLPEVELREVAGLELQSYGTSGAYASWRGMRLVPGSMGVCPVPCGAILDGRQGREFFFGGEGIRTSSHFQLGNESGDVLIKVRPSSGVQWNAGEGLTIAGSPLMLLGTVVLAAQSGETPPSATAAAAIFTANSAALVIAGIVLMATGRTSYSLHRIPPPRGAP